MNDDQTKQQTVPNDGTEPPEVILEKAVDEAIAEAPAPKMFWSVNIDWKEGSTDDERAQAEILVLPLIKGVTDSPEDHLPLCIEALTVKRIHD